MELPRPQQPGQPKPHWSTYLRGERKQRGVMNKTEAKYHAEMLQPALDTGFYAWCEYEAITLRLAKGVRYTPDFVTMRSDGLMEVFEVKGYMNDRDRVKLRVAAEQFPFRFYLVTKQLVREGGGWKVEEV